MSQDAPNTDPILASTRLEHGGKIFFLDHKTNARGHYVKLVEAVQGRRDTTLLPIEVVVAIARFLAESARRAGVFPDSPSPTNQTQPNPGAAPAVCPR